VLHVEHPDNLSVIACCSPTAEDASERKASCSPPQWGGGELPTSHRDVDI